MKVKVAVVSDSLQPHGLVACQAPLSTEFSRQDTGVGSHSLLLGIFPTQGSNLGLLHCWQIFFLTIGGTREAQQHLGMHI